MTTVFSTLIHSGGNNRQPSQSAPQSFNSNRQIYHDLFTSDSMTGKENDFDLSYVIKNAIGQLKNSSHSRLNRPRSTSAKMPNYKHPCGICQKSVSKNQKAICCSLCFNWVHRKCNGSSLKEYDLLVVEDDSTFWQCILCDIEDLTAKFLLVFSPKWNFMIYMVWIFPHK